MAVIDQPTQEILTPAAYFWLQIQFSLMRARNEHKNQFKVGGPIWTKLQTRSNTLHLSTACPANIVYEKRKDEEAGSPGV